MKQLLTILLVWITVQVFAQDSTVIRVTGRFKIALPVPIDTTDPEPVDTTNYIAGNYTFTIPSQKRVSIGVYDSATDVLLRTISSNETLEAGTYTRHFDGYNDDGDTIVSPYKIKYLTSNVQYTWEGVIGNTSSSFTGGGIIHGYDLINGMVQAGDYLYACIGYNEAQGTKIKIPASNPTSKEWILPSGQGSTQETRFVATDGTNIYWAEHDPYSTDYWVHRTAVSNDLPVAFSSGTAVDKVTTIDYASVIDHSTDTITGLAVNDDFIFITHPDNLKVYTKSTGALVQTLDFDSAHHVTVDGSNVWMVVDNVVSKYAVNEDGSLSSALLLIPDLVKPLALAVKNDTITVVDGGASQQIKHFSTTSGAYLMVMGQEGGYATSAAVANNKFMFGRTFIAYQTDGSYWVGDDGNFRSQHFSADDEYINNIAYLPVTYIIAVDKAEPTRVFAQHLEFEVSYTDINDWNLKNNWLYNAPSNNSSQSSFNEVTTLSNGKTYTAVRAGTGYMELAEMVDGGNLRLTGLTYHPEYVLSPDGSLTKQWKSDFAGGYTVWVNKPLTGFDDSNNPIWGTEVELERSPFVGYDTSLIDVKEPAYRGNGQEYKPYEITSTGIRPNFYGGINLANESSYHLGGVKNEAFVFKTAKSTHTNYEGDFPTDGSFDIGNGVSDFAGSNAMAIERSIFWGYHGEFWKDGQANMWNHIYDNGLMVGQFGTSTSAYVEGAAMMAGNAFITHMVKVGSDYYMYQNDEFYHSGVHRWKISGLNTISIQNADVTTTSEADTLPGVDLMVGLPFNSNLVNNTAGWTRSPATNNSYVTMSTSATTINKVNGDDVQASFKNGQGTSYVQRDLPQLPDDHDWTLEGKIAWGGSASYTGGNGGMLQVLVYDNNDKVIASLNYSTSFSSDPQHIYFNNHSIVQAASTSDADNLAFEKAYAKKIHPFSISNSSGTLTVNYADVSYSTTTAYDTDSNKSQPAKLVIRNVDNNVVTYDRSINVCELRLINALID